MSVAGGVYVCKRGWQPVCVGTDVEGALVWELRPKEAWHLKEFPVPYGGDFSEQWMWKCLREKIGMEWVAEEASR